MTLTLIHAAALLPLTNAGWIREQTRYTGSVSSGENTVPGLRCQNRRTFVLKPLHHTRLYQKYLARLKSGPWVPEHAYGITRGARA
ncbi:hypothetical protein DEU56DRAFT_794610 [Suillus clintonianus]|uniref:uncharacterized protein n=1 Tax=Suillus clintonianus TaxID=1904413 RepID=UPI001B874D79|nr:uncharacterized protein DEU56DRAFT_794610 [Suillus clintonianus]KAG2142466.1 hypothetical protein DEU56DRAFT_794610 [Suillus clintonianus]